MDINIEPAWNITNGNENITVAVIDCGVDRNHEDMENRVLDGYTALNVNGRGAPQNVNVLNSKTHGMACSGIIAAVNNNIGIRGVANNTRVLPVNIVPNFAFRHPWNNQIIVEGYAEDIEIARAINWAWKRADILSCSWGGGEPSTEITMAIDSARVFGRNGFGCPVIFASGNGNDNPLITDVSFPANINGVITVGAINNRGVIHNYSQRGASMDLVAPSGGNPGDVVTTDRPGDLGYVAGNYYMNFNGTSAACPQVVGVAALMLSVRPDLTEAQVRATLQNTARDLGTTGFDNTYGFGLVDAHAAVYAVAPRISGPSTICDQAIYTIENFPEGATVQWSVRNNLSILSGKGTDSIVVQKNTNGLSTITAVMSLNNQEIATIRKNIQTGSDFPVFALYDASTHAQVQIGTTGELHYFSATGNNLPSQPDSFHWTLIPPNPNDIPYTFTGQQFSFTAFEEGYYTVILKINGECGWSEENQVVYYFQNNGGFILFPNPASKSVTVDVSEMTNKTTSSLLKAQNENYTIQLWNSFGIVRQITADKTSYQLDLTGVPPGFYYVHVIKDGLTYSRQLIIK